MKRPKLTIFIFVVVFVTLILFLVIFSVYKANRSPTRTNISKNKDTGQTIISDPNQKPENFNINGYVSILGEDKLVSDGMTQAQLTEFNSLLTSYINQQLKQAYSQVSILNNGYSFSGNEAKGQLRLGNTTNLLNIDVVFQNLNQIELKLTDPSGNQSYTYDSGLIVVPST